MNRRLLIYSLVTLMFLGISTVAYGQATRTWVSGVGDDVNPCSRTAPCKTYAGAISKTAKDGEISTLDPGGFGTVTITKSITINGTQGQGYGSILAALATQGVLVNITDPADVRKTVRLNSLYINGASTGQFGIRVLAATNVHINDVIIDGFTSRCVEIALTATSTNVYINDSILRKCSNGVRVTTTAGVAVAVMNNVFIEAMTSHGMDVSTNGFATVKGGSSSSNVGAGYATTGNGQMNIVNSIMAHNAAGVNAAVGTTMRVASCQIFNNTVAWTIAGTVSTDGQNRVANNGAGGQNPAGPAITLQ
jgi:hypothetical protein